MFTGVPWGWKVLGTCLNSRFDLDLRSMPPVFDFDFVCIEPLISGEGQMGHPISDEMPWNPK